MAVVFLYNKSNFLNRSFITELNKFISIYRSISYFDTQKINEAAEIVSSNNPLEFFVEENKIKSSLDFQLTKVNGTLSKITDKKVHKFSLVQVGIKRKMETVKAVIIHGQQDFELHDQLNPTEIKIDNGQIINLLKKYKSALYQFTLDIGLLFLLSVTNDTNRIFVTCRDLDMAKIPLRNGKILNILAVININMINNWVKIKGKSVWINANFEKLKDKKSDHFTFSFKKFNLSDLFFSVYLIDSDNNKIIIDDSKKNYHIKL